MTGISFDLRGLSAAAVTAVALLSLSACTDDKVVETQKQPNVELIQDMMDQRAIKAQGYDHFKPDQPGSRLPPEGTVSRGHAPYPYHLDPAGAEKLKNPMAGDFSPATLELGHKKYEIYCTPCHGGGGAGDGLVAPKMVLKPANLTSKVIVDKSDAHYFHVITDGYGGMGAYGGQIPSEHDRWAIVNYVRSLQKLAAGGKPEGASKADAAAATRTKTK